MGDNQHTELPASQSTSDSGHIARPEIVSKERYWGNVTDPRLHNSQQYRYLVHAFNTINEEQNPQIPYYGYSEQQGIDLLQEPNRLAQRVSLSMSLIDQNHTDVWGATGGIIVLAPEDNVIIAHSNDAGVPNSSREDLLQVARTLEKLSADEVLEGTTRKGLPWNEVVAWGSNGQHQLQLDGFFIVVDVDGDVADVDLANRLKDLAQTNKKPLVEIVYGNFHQDILLRNENELVAHVKGKQYTLRSNTPWERFVVDTGVKSYFATKEEVETVINYFIETEQLSESDRSALLTEYDNAYKEKTKGYASYDGGFYAGFVAEVGSNEVRYEYAKDKVTKITAHGGHKKIQEIPLIEFLAALEQHRNNFADKDYEKVIKELSPFAI